MVKTELSTTATRVESRNENKYALRSDNQAVSSQRSRYKAMSHPHNHVHIPEQSTVAREGQNYLQVAWCALQDDIVGSMVRCINFVNCL